MCCYNFVPNFPLWVGYGLYLSNISLIIDVLLMRCFENIFEEAAYNRDSLWYLTSVNMYRYLYNLPELHLFIYYFSVEVGLD